MSARRDPPRFSEEGPDALRALMSTVHDRGPSDAAAARIAKQLAMAGVPMTRTKGTRVAGRWAASHKLSLVAIAALGLTVAGWEATHVSSASSSSGSSSSGSYSPESVTTSAAAPLPTEASERLPSSETAETAPLENVDPIAPAVVAHEELPSAARRSLTRAAPPAGGVKGKATTGDGVETKAPSELELLQRAQSALAATPARALAITNEHARAYPSGELAQERELIAVEALARTGQNDQAYERARALVQRYPRTPYAARIELALGRPLPAPDAAPNP